MVSASQTNKLTFPKVRFSILIALIRPSLSGITAMPNSQAGCQVSASLLRVVNVRLNDLPNTLSSPK